MKITKSQLKRLIKESILQNEAEVTLSTPDPVKQTDSGLKVTRTKGKDSSSSANKESMKKGLNKVMKAAKIGKLSFEKPPSFLPKSFQKVLKDYPFELSVWQKFVKRRSPWRI